MGGMDNAQAYDRLVDYQSRIVTCIDGAVELLALDPEAARMPLARIRWTMVRILREYQLFKHREIFDPVIVRDDRYSPIARRLKEACLAAADQHLTFVARWNAGDVAARWHEYRPAMAARSAQLRRDIARERREVATLLAGCSLGRRAVAAATPLPVRSPPAARADSRAR